LSTKFNNCSALVTDAIYLGQPENKALCNQDDVSESSSNHRGKIMRTCQATNSTSLPMSWSYVWPVMMISMISGLVLGCVGALLVGIMGGPAEAGGAVGALLGSIGTAPASIGTLISSMQARHRTAT
jgi:hypothetical protein